MLPALEEAVVSPAPAPGSKLSFGPHWEGSSCLPRSSHGTVLSSEHHWTSWGKTQFIHLLPTSTHIPCRTPKHQEGRPSVPCSPEQWQWSSRGHRMGAWKYRGTDDGRRERVFCSGAICGPWYSIEHTGHLLQNKERIRGGHKCCDGSELLIYS